MQWHTIHTFVAMTPESINVKLTHHTKAAAVYMQGHNRKLIMLYPHMSMCHDVQSDGWNNLQLSHTFML